MSFHKQEDTADALQEKKKSLAGKEKTEGVEMPRFGIFDKCSPEDDLAVICIVAGSDSL